MSGTASQTGRVQEALARVSDSATFRNVPRLRRLLEYLVTSTLEGRSAELKEYSIGLDVFDRGQDFDPKTDSIVRYEARRLRGKLNEYYDGPGATDTLRIRLPKGSYIPEFEWKPLASRNRPSIAIWVALAVVALASGFMVVRERRQAAENSVFILPFRNSDPNTQALSNGLTEEIRESLSRMHGLRVLVQAPAEVIRAGEGDYRKLGGKLDVGAILAGDVSAKNGVTSLHYLLIRTADGSLMTEGRVDVPDAGVAAVETSVVADTARAFRLPAPHPDPSTTNAEAHNLYLEGRYLWRTRRKAEILQAIDLYNRALQLDANYASAYTGLADAYALMTANEQMDASVGVPRGMEAARQAVLRDPDSAEAHAALGLLHYCRWEWPEADREYRTALQLNPNYGFLYVRMAMVSVAFGRFEEAEQLLQRGRAADPFSMSIPNTLAQVYLYWRRPAAAIQLSKQILGLSPSDDVSHQTLAIAYFEQGDFEAATREEEMWERFSPNDLGNELGGLPLRAKTIGRAKASRIFSEIEQKASRGAFVGELNLAFGAIAVDERQQAMSYLKLAYRNHVTDLVCARWYPAFDPLHGDPEFEQIFKDMGVAGK